MLEHACEGFEKSRLRSLLDHLGRIEDPREPWRVAFPLREVLLLVVCGTICDCDDYDLIAAWGETHLSLLRRYLPYERGVPGGRWLTILMNRINPGLFSAVFTDWVRETWPDRPEFIALDGKTSRRSHDRAAGQAPLHLVSAFATTSRLVLGQEAVADKASETSAIPVLLERLAADGALKGAVVSIDAIATNAAIAASIRHAGADYLLAVKGNQPTLRREIEAFFNDAPETSLERHDEVDKGHGRIEERVVRVSHQTDWLQSERRFPGELRLPDVAAIIKVESKTELKDRRRRETRYYISSAKLGAAALAEAVRGHWAIENSLHWVMDVVFKDDLSRLRKGHGAKNMAVVRHFAVNLARSAPEPARPTKTWGRKPANPTRPTKTSVRARRKIAGWNPDYLHAILATSVR